MQALSKTEDRAVATSTRNLLRSLGAVFGVAISTAAQYAAIDVALRDRIPAPLLSQVLDGSWKIGTASSEAYQPQILDAKMKGFRVVFIILVPLMCLCTLGNLFVRDTVLRGDAKKDKEEEKDRPNNLDSKPLSSNGDEKREEDLICKGEVTLKV